MPRLFLAGAYPFFSRLCYVFGVGTNDAPFGVCSTPLFPPENPMPTFPPEGAVVMVTNRPHPRFPRPKYRPCVALSGALIPLSSGQCRRHHLVPNDSNNLLRPCDALWSFEFVWRTDCQHTVVGQLSPLELATLRAKQRICGLPTVPVELV